MFWQDKDLHAWRRPLCSIVTSRSFPAEFDLSEEVANFIIFSIKLYITIRWRFRIYVFSVCIKTRVGHPPYLSPVDNQSMIDKIGHTICNSIQFNSFYGTWGAIYNMYKCMQYTSYTWVVTKLMEDRLFIMGRHEPAHYMK